MKVTYKGNRIRRYRDEFALSADTIKLKTHTVSSTLYARPYEDDRRVNEDDRDAVLGDEQTDHRHREASANTCRGR